MPVRRPGRRAGCSMARRVGSPTMLSGMAEGSIWRSGTEAGRSALWDVDWRPVTPCLPLGPTLKARFPSRSRLSPLSPSKGTGDNYVELAQIQVLGAGALECSEVQGLDGAAMLFE